jgi:aryl-alcohol dehydrogenase-like predicted oxidoreductase
MDPPRVPFFLNSNLYSQLKPIPSIPDAIMTSSPLPLKPFGLSGPSVSIIGFGAIGLSAFYGQVPSDPERLALLTRAWELGCRHWDTADMYADNEDLIGKWFAANPDKRKDIFLATKFGVTGGMAEMVK